MSKLKKIAQTDIINGLQAKVYRDAEWNEYRVRFYFDGQLNAEADYFTGDKQDALMTATNTVAKQLSKEVK